MKVSLKVKRIKGLGKIRGLIGSSEPQAIVFKTRFGIHTFGLKFPIDVLVLGKSGHVVKLVQTLKPNRIFFWHPKYKYILELPEGMIKAKNIKLGTYIKLTT